MCSCTPPAPAEYCLNWLKAKLVGLGKTPRISRIPRVRRRTQHVTSRGRYFRQARQHRAGAYYGVASRKQGSRRRRSNRNRSFVGSAFSAQLIPEVAALLTKHGFARDDIDGFVVASGPGSFTGLRVGLAAVKALAEVLEKPIAAVSLLKALPSPEDRKAA